MRVLSFVHLSLAMPSAAPLFTGAAVLAIALALGACSTPQRVQLTTSPITLPSASMATGSQLQTARPTHSATPHASTSATTSPTAAPPSLVPPTVARLAPTLVDASCGSQPAEARPTAILLACADGSLRLEHITYTSYGPASAGGHAVMHANTCRPNCAAGAFKDYPATLVLDHAVGSRFTEATLHYAVPGPDGRTTASYPIQ